VVTRALGTDPDVDVDTFSIDPKPGDLFLICSDGLTSMVSDEGILDEIRSHRDDLRAAAKALVRAANKGGGEDNITVVFFEIQSDEDASQRTVTLPPPEAEEDDADTLDELDAVPAVQARRERKEHPVRRRVVFATLLLILVLVAGALGVWGLWRSHFVGAEPDGHVAVYQGVPWNIAGNVHLYRTVYESPLLVAQLSRSERKKLFDHSLRSKHSALDEVRKYEEQLGR
jgi:protein phosphatase